MNVFPPSVVLEIYPLGTGYPVITESDCPATYPVFPSKNQPVLRSLLAKPPVPGVLSGDPAELLTDHVSPPSADFMKIPLPPTAKIFDASKIFTHLRVCPAGCPLSQYQPFTSC